MPRRYRASRKTLCNRQENDPRVANLSSEMAATEDELRTRDSAAAQRAADPRAPIDRPADPSNAVEFRGVSKLYDVSKAGLEQRDLRRPARRVRLPRRPDRLGQVDAHAAADQGARAGRGHDPRRRARPQRADAQAAPVLPPQPRRRLPGLQAAAQPHGARQRRLRAAGHRELAQGDPRQGARHPAPHRACRRSSTTIPDQLSGGEQQRVSIARAFVNHPPLLLADEPTGNLDPETSVGIMQLLYRINRTGTTVLVATHDNSMVDRMRRRVIELDSGRIIRDELAGRYAPTDMSTAEFGALLREPAPEPQRRSARASPATTSTRRSETDEDRLLLPRGAAEHSPQRRPELRRAGVGARHGARARRLHPDRPGDDRRRQRRARPRARRTST